MEDKDQEPHEGCLRWTTGMTLCRWPRGPVWLLGPESRGDGGYGHGSRADYMGGEAVVSFPLSDSEIGLVFRVTIAVEMRS